MDTDTDATARPPSTWGRRRGLIIGIVMLAIILVAGFLVGQWLLRPAETTLIAPGTVVELRMVSGQVLLGTYAGEQDDYIILAAPAALSEPDERGAVTLRSLATDPTSIGGNILVAEAQVAYIGGVLSDSDLFDGYRQATEGGAAPIEPPSPAPS